MQGCKDWYGSHGLKCKKKFNDSLSSHFRVILLLYDWNGLNTRLRVINSDSYISMNSTLPGVVAVVVSVVVGTVVATEVVTKGVVVPRKKCYHYKNDW